ncbi:hypothetical protein LguiA_024186 [Lonicera macranthoides]
MESAKDFFLKHYADIVVPRMLRRYGLGPRPINTEPNVLIVEELTHLDVLLPSERNYPGLHAFKTTQNGSGDQVSEVGALQEGSTGEIQPVSPGDRVLTVAPFNRCLWCPRKVITGAKDAPEQTFRPGQTNEGTPDPSAQGGFAFFV